MPDPIERPDPAAPRRLARGSRHRPRFVLPRDDQDDGSAERIEAFLDGTPRTSQRHRALHLRREPLRRPRQRVPMDTRTDWEQALRHEDLRFARYGRPVAVLVVEIRPTDDSALDATARRVGEIVRDVARAPDRVTRASQRRFHVLLPETDEAAATTLGSRIRRAVRSASPEGGADRWDVVSAAAAPSHGATLADALRLAQARVAE